MGRFNGSKSRTISHHRASLEIDKAALTPGICCRCRDVDNFTFSQLDCAHSMHLDDLNIRAHIWVRLFDMERRHFVREWLGLCHLGVLTARYKSKTVGVKIGCEKLDSFPPVCNIDTTIIGS